MQGLVVVCLIVEKIWNVNVNCVKVNGAQNIGQGHWVNIPAKSGGQGDVSCKAGLEKLKNPNRSSIFSPQKRKLPNRFSVISVTVVCFHSVLFFSFKIQGASSLLAQRLTYQYCFNTCSININIGISIINSNFAPTVQTRHISSTFIFPISGSLSY